MNDIALILVATVFANNFVLSRFLGLCPFMGVSNRNDSALGMALATTFVMTLASVCSYVVHRYLLVPFALEWLRTLVFIVLIASLVQLTELMLRAHSPVLHRVLGLYLPLITTNCAVLGVALLNVDANHSLLQSAVYGAGAAVGFSLVLVLFAGLRERLHNAPVPQAFQGAPIALITAGLMALAFMGLANLA